MKKAIVSVLIVNYNGKHLLKTLLDSIKKSNFKDFETLVVDNSSTDGSQEFIRKKYKNVKLVQNEENLGYSGINSALEYCNGKYILFLNNDMKIDKYCIGELVRTIQSVKNAAMAAPKLVNFYNKKLMSGGTWVSRAFYNGHIKENGGIGEIPYLGVGLIKKDFVRIFDYLFDPDYFIYAEDLDLGLRIRLHGERTIFEPKAIMHHMHATTTKKTSKAFTTFLMERNLLITFFKILSAKNIILYLPYVLFTRLIAIIRDVLTLKINAAFSRLKAILFILLNFDLIMKKRQQVQKFRKVGDEFIFKVFNEKYLFKRRFII